MGKLLRQQRRGKGSPRYRAHTHRHIGKPTYSETEGEGVVVNIKHATGRLTPTAVVDYKGKRKLMLPADGMFIGQKVDMIKELKNIPEGTKIFNIELNPRDGGKLCRSSGAFATVVSKTADKCIVLLPSREKKALSTSCRATMGIVASSGRTDKPFRKAGTKHFAMKARGKLYPRTSGVSMNAVDHPFGGQTRPGKPKTVSRHMPPGKKVGSISAKRTGKRKKG